MEDRPRRKTAQPPPVPHEQPAARRDREPPRVAEPLGVSHIARDGDDVATVRGHDVERVVLLVLGALPREEDPAPVRRDMRMLAAHKPDRLRGVDRGAVDPAVEGVHERAPRGRAAVGEGRSGDADRECHGDRQQPELHAFQLAKHGPFTRTRFRPPSTGATSTCPGVGSPIVPYVPHPRPARTNRPSRLSAYARRVSIQRR